MENLKVEKINFSLKDTLIRIGDISFFEGPLLTLFENFVDKNLYLYDWIDRDKNYNRWLIYKVNPQDLLKFLNRKMSHFEIFERVSEFFVADIDSITDFKNYEINRLIHLPEAYIPNKDSFFDKEDCPSFDKLLSFLSRSLSSQQQENYYSYKSYRLCSILDFSYKEEKNNIYRQELDYSYKEYLEGSFLINTHLEIETADENNFDISVMYALYSTKKVHTPKQKNIYAHV